MKPAPGGALAGTGTAEEPPFVPFSAAPAMSPARLQHSDASNKSHICGMRIHALRNGNEVNMRCSDAGVVGASAYADLTRRHTDCFSRWCCEADFSEEQACR